MLMRWILLLQEFDLEIRDKKRSKNLVVDRLSRFDPLVMQPTNDGRIKETFILSLFCLILCIEDIACSKCGEGYHYFQF